MPAGSGVGGTVRDWMVLVGVISNQSANRGTGHWKGRACCVRSPASWVQRFSADRGTGSFGGGGLPIRGQVCGRATEGQVLGVADIE